VRLAERVFAYEGVMQAIMIYEREQAEGGDSERRVGARGSGPHESPRADLADRTIIPLTRELVAAGGIPGLENDRGLIEHAQV
jgi:hypothetical protein